MHFLCALMWQAIFDVPIYVSVVFTQRTTWSYTDLPCPTQVFDLVYHSTMPNLFVGTLTTPKRSQEFGVALNGFYINFVSHIKLRNMGAQIPEIEEKPLAGCGCRKFQIDLLGDYLCTCTAHSGAKKAHDRAVDQIADVFRTTHQAKTRQVARSRGQHCGDIDLAGYLANAAGPLPLVLDLRIAHERFGSSSDPSINGYLVTK
jgi:hypothetical protein